MPRLAYSFTVYGFRSAGFRKPSLLDRDTQTQAELAFRLLLRV
jgi:hypothetical protein